MGAFASLIGRLAFSIEWCRMLPCKTLSADYW